MKRAGIDSIRTDRVSFVHKSGNAKTGPIPVSYSSGRTCPDSCPLKANGCYAESSRVRMHWSKGERFGTWKAFLANVRAIPEGQLWRHNVAGDLPGDGDTIDVKALRELCGANKGRAYTYTHKPLRLKREREAVRLANQGGFTINLSADSLTEADQLAELHVGPVVVTLPSDSERHLKTPAGRHVVVCPAQLRDDVTCESCGLCAKQRKAIVGFLAHGQSHKRIDSRLKLKVLQ